jgi:uncharacterized peroxidase-related enzyme
VGLHTAAVRRLTGDEHLGFEFATNWPQYDLGDDTRAMLQYATKLTETPSMMEESDIAALKASGFSEEAVRQITALASFFNYSGRLEAASGLPPDEIPEGAKFAEATVG